MADPNITLVLAAGDRADCVELQAVPLPLGAGRPVVLRVDAGQMLAAITQLVQQGVDEQTPAAAMAATSPAQPIEGPLAKIAERAAARQLPGEWAVFFGPGVHGETARAWRSRHPLWGRSVLVGRALRQAESLVRRLESLGARAVVLPAIEIGPPPDIAAVQQTIARLAEFDWLVFTSGNGVTAFVEQLFSSGRDLRALAGRLLAAIGPGTAETLAAHWLHVDLVPSQFHSEGLAAALLPLAQGRRVLLLRADRGRDVLYQQLSAVAQVEQVAVYSQRDTAAADPAVLHLVHQGAIDYAAASSSNIARNLVRLLGMGTPAAPPRPPRFVSISPVTSAALRDAGVEPAAQAAVFTIEGLVQAIVGLEQRSPQV
jgi:uroporphyrinogen III methyltransferase/synthase